MTYLVNTRPEENPANKGAVGRGEKEGQKILIISNSWSYSAPKEPNRRHSAEETHPIKSLCSIAANDSTSDSLLPTFLADHIGMNRSSSAVEVLRYQWTLTRELTSSFCMESGKDNKN